MQSPPYVNEERPEPRPEAAVQNVSPQVPNTEAEHERVPSMTMSRTAFIVALLITGLLSAAGSYWYSVRTAAKFVQMMSTPIAVLDANQIIHAAILDNSVAGDRGAEGLARVRRASDRLAAKGYIVLDAGSVLSAPPQYYAAGLATSIEGGVAPEAAAP